jgi:hypothetical protein
VVFKENDVVKEVIREDGGAVIEVTEVLGVVVAMLTVLPEVTPTVLWECEGVDWTKTKKSSDAGSEKNFLNCRTEAILAPSDCSPGERQPKIADESSPGRGRSGRGGTGGRGKRKERKWKIKLQSMVTSETLRLRRQVVSLKLSCW